MEAGESMAYAAYRRVGDLLRDEQRVLLSRLEDLAWALSRHDRVAAASSFEVLRPGLDLHRRKQQKVVLPSLIGHLGIDVGAVSATMAEHGHEMTLIDALETALATGSLDAIEEAGESLILFLRAHLWKEESFVLPVIEASLGPAERRSLGERLEAAGRVGAARSAGASAEDRGC